MSTTPSVSIESLQRENVNYQPVLQNLPALLLEPVLALLHANLLEVEGEDRRTNIRRKGMLMGPYVPGTSGASEKEIMKIIESSLKVDKCYIGLKDYIGNYKAKKVLSNQGEKIDNKSKKHPLEQEILNKQVTTFIEDFVVSMFHAERDDSGKTPLDSFDGLYTKLALLIAAGEISTAKGNLIETGAFVTPANSDDIAAYTKIVAWFEAFNPFLKNVQFDWHVPQTVLSYIKKAYKNKVKAFKDPTLEEVLQAIKDDAMLSYVPNAIYSPILGTGQRMTATIPGNIDIGMNTKSDTQFVQVRSPYEDPNFVQFWIQGDFGTRWNDWHSKIFACNEQSSVANILLAGDYQS